MIQNIWFFLIVLFLPSFAFSKAADKVKLDSPYIRMVPKASKATALFVTLENQDDQDHVLVSAHSHGLSRLTELHNHIKEGDVFKMREVSQIKIPAHSKVSLEPGGYHVMLMGVQKELKVGNKYLISFKFKDGSEIDQYITVESK